MYDEIGEGVPEGTEFSTPETLHDSRAEIEASGLFSDTVWIPGASVKSLRLGLWRLQWCPVEQRVTLVHGEGCGPRVRGRAPRCPVP